MTDIWGDFAEVFADVPQMPLTPEQMDALADEYQREQIATAQSEAAQEEMRFKYSTPAKVARRF
jgi:hypothetical protein